MNVQDDVIKYENFHVCITVCSKINSFKDYYPPVFCVWNVELSRRDFRVTMFYDHVKGLHHDKSLENLNQCFGKNAPSRTKTFFSFDEFKRGGVWMTSSGAAHQRLLLQLQTSRQGCGKKKIKIEPRLTTLEIQESLSIGTAATMSILHNHLRVLKRCARSPVHWQTNN